MNIIGLPEGYVMMEQFDELLSQETNWSAILICITDKSEINVLCQLIVLLTVKHAAEINRRVFTKLGRFLTADVAHKRIDLHLRHRKGTFSTAQ